MSTLTEYQRALLTNIWEKLNNRKVEFEILERDDFSSNCKHGIISRCLDDLDELDLKNGHFAEVAPSKAIFVHLAPLIANESERVSVLTYHVQEIRDLDEEEDFPEVKKRFEKVKVILENILLRCEDIMSRTDEPSTIQVNKRFFTSEAPNYRYVLAKTSRSKCLGSLRLWLEKEPENTERWVQHRTELEDYVAKAVRRYLNPAEVPNEQDPLQMSAAIQYVINESAHLWKQPLIPAKSNIIGYVERLLKFEVQALRQEMGYTITMPKKGGTSSSYFESLRYIFFIIFSTLICFVLLWLVGEKTVRGCI